MIGRSESIGCLVVAGKDFSEAVEHVLREWKITLILKKDANKLSTRGLLEYEDTTFGRKESFLSCYTETNVVQPRNSSTRQSRCRWKRGYRRAHTPSMIFKVSGKSRAQLSAERAIRERKIDSV